jgi:hypothetical protein
MKSPLSPASLRILVVQLKTAIKRKRKPEGKS